MADTRTKLPETMTAPESGAILTRGVRPFVVTYKGAHIKVDLPGYYPSDGSDGVHVGNDMAIVDDALHDLKEQVEGVPAPELRFPGR